MLETESRSAARAASFLSHRVNPSSPSYNAPRWTDLSGPWLFSSVFSSILGPQGGFCVLLCHGRLHYCCFCFRVYQHCSDYSSLGVLVPTQASLGTHLGWDGRVVSVHSSQLVSKGQRKSIQRHTETSHFPASVPTFAITRFCFCLSSFSVCCGQSCLSYCVKSHQTSTEKVKLRPQRALVLPQGDGAECLAQFRE